MDAAEAVQASSDTQPPPAVLEEADLELILHELERFAGEQLEPATSRHEQPVESHRLQAMSAQLCGLGLLNLSGDSGLGIWDDPDSGAGMHLSINALRRIARCSAGVAYLWHRMALGARLSRRLGLEAEELPGQRALLSHGHHGLARSALPAWMHGAPGDPELLASWLDPAAEAHLLWQRHWQQLLRPVWQGESVQWQLLTRRGGEAVRQLQAPGFDELTSFAVRGGTSVQTSGLSPAASRGCLAEVLLLDALGLLAIACGSLERGRALAWNYAQARSQGGSKIIEHPAVGLMLADISGAIAAADQFLTGCAGQPAAGDLGRVFAARSQLHPLLCQGADQALQLHGGNGYMRDVGVEKVWREQQTLRRLGGTGLDLRMFVTAWERCA